LSGLDWTKILAAGGIPEPPGYRECVEALKDSRLAAARQREEEQRQADEAYRQQLAKKADTRKATRSKVRVGR
jgi:hypothetical protein